MLWEKGDALTDVEWHLVGSLQTNKVVRTLRYSPCIHSCDSARLYDALAAESEKQAKRIRIFLEVNISGDPSKHGWSPDNITPFLRKSRASSNLDVIGLMGMSGFESTPEQRREEFHQLAQLRGTLEPLAHQSGFGQFNELSMGMTDDFELAIEEGSTMVRIGSALWEGVDLG
jgi:PLP dependent protein